MAYKFRREDTGEVVEVPWDVMMTQDAAGYIEIDGVPAKRCWHLEEHETKRAAQPPKQLGQPIVSDTLGFGQCCLADMEKDRQDHCFSGVEFIRDPDVPEFYRVKCSSRREYDRYVKHRGYVNATGVGGLRLTQEELDRAAELATRGLDDGELQRQT